MNLALSLQTDFFFIGAYRILEKSTSYVNNIYNHFGNEKKLPKEKIPTKIPTFNTPR